MNDTILVETLIDSCSRQLDLYRDLNAVTQTILSRVILARGDCSGVASAFERKREILSSIARERDLTQPAIARWGERKTAVPRGDRVVALDALIAQMGRVIEDFLGKEDQLKKFLERATGASEGPAPR